MANNSHVKITRVETILASGYTFVRVHTDAGLTGLGEMHPASNTSGGHYTPPGFITFIEEYLIGKDPTHIERHWQHMFRRSLFRGGSDSMAAIAAVDMALWDITGKLAGLPVYKLLGGPTREKVKVFGTPGSRGGRLTPDGMADSARQLVEEQGFSAVRLYPLGERPTFADMGLRAIVRTAESYVAAVRTAVGDEIDVAIDVICLLSPAEAIAVGRALEPYGLCFFEDPIEPDNIDAMAHVAASIPMPVATGERLCTMHQFRDILHKRAAEFLRPDLGLAGGITNCRKIAVLAEADYIGIIPHCPLSWVVTAASVHLCAAIHNVAIMEFQYQGNVLESPIDALFREPLKLEDGYVLVPDRPGLGIELNDEALKHFPPSFGQRPAIVSRDGALRDY